MTRAARDAADLVQRVTGIKPTVEIGKHVKLIMAVNGKSRFVVTAATPSDRRGLLNLTRDIKRIHRELLA